MLALHGGVPVRTKPFTRWPIFDEAEEERLLGHCAAATGRLDGDEVSRFEERFAAMHGCRHGSPS
jgi:dTDP-4-amino-4,6-dideoxygalactose transaminase